MRRRRLGLGAAGVMVVVLAIGAVTQFMGSSGPARLLTIEDVAQAAEASADATSGRFGFVLDMSLPDGEILSFTGTGVFDTASRRSAVSVDMSSLGSLLESLADASPQAADLADDDLWKLEAREEGLTMYLRFPLLAKDPSWPRGKTWVAIDLRRAGLDQKELEKLREYGSSDPRDMLESLEALGGTLERIGTERLHSDEVTRYRATIDVPKYLHLEPGAKRGSTPQQLLAQAETQKVPVDVWVDAEGLVRKLEMTFPSKNPDSADEVQASLRFEFYDYGATVTIPIPQARDVVGSAELSA